MKHVLRLLGHGAGIWRWRRRWTLDAWHWKRRQAIFAYGADVGANERTQDWGLASAQLGCWWGRHR
jgi:hypothetical protein